MAQATINSRIRIGTAITWPGKPLTFVVVQVLKHAYRVQNQYGKEMDFWSWEVEEQADGSFTYNAKELRCPQD